MMVDTQAGASFAGRDAAAAGTSSPQENEPSMHEVMTMMESMMGKLEVLKKDIDSVRKDKSDLLQGISGVDLSGEEPRGAASGAEVSARVATQKPADVAERRTISIGVAQKIYAVEPGEYLVSELGDSRSLAKN